MPDQAPLSPTDTVWINMHMDVACPAHVPAIASDGWWALRWRVMSPEEIEGFTRTRGEPPRCRACEALGDSRAG